MTTFALKGDWNIAKGKMKQRWATLTDDDLRFVEGQQDELVGRIQKRTGEQREAIEQALNDSCRSGNSRPPTTVRKPEKENTS